MAAGVPAGAGANESAATAAGTPAIDGAATTCGAAPAGAGTGVASGGSTASARPILLIGQSRRRQQQYARDGKRRQCEDGLW